MGETYARRRIRDSAARAGFTVEDMYWEPIGQMVEKSGRSGGWTVFLRDKDGGTDHALGYRWQDVVEFIEAIEEA